jgi:hypothetical protein
MGGECTTTHDGIQCFFASIARDAKFHVLCEQTHVLLTPSLQSSWQRMDIALKANGICTLTNVVIIDLTRANLIS